MTLKIKEYGTKENCSVKITRIVFTLSNCVWSVTTVAFMSISLKQKPSQM
jgi:hypothetical protein